VADVEVTFTGDIEDLEDSIDQARESVQSFVGDVTKLSNSAQGLTTALTTTSDAASQLQDDIDDTAASTQAASTAIAKMQTANANAVGGFTDLTNRAREASGGFLQTTENILNTINHLKLLALAAYAMSPAFRAMVNPAVTGGLTLVRGQLGAMAPTLEAIGSRALPLVMNGLSFFSRVAVPIGAAVLAFEGFNAVIHKGAELLDQFSGAERKLFGEDVDDELKKLTKFQEVVDPAVVARATALASRLDEAKRNISDFLKVQIDLTTPALLLQRIWVGIVGAIGDAAKGANDLIKKTNGPEGNVPKTPGMVDVPGVGPVPTGQTEDLQDQVLKGDRLLDTMFDAMKHAKAVLAAGLGGGGSMVGRFTQDIDALAGKKDKDTTEETPDHDAARAAMEAAQGAIQAANREYENTIEKLNSALAMHKITEEEKTAATIAAINTREAADLAALSQAAQRDDLTKDQFVRLQNEITAAEQQANNARQKAQDQAMQAYVKDWQSALQPLESGFNSQLRGLLAGTETWGQAMKKIFGDVVIAGIQEIEKLVFQWIAGEAAKTTATILGNAVRATANEAGAAAAIGSKASEAVATIGIDVAEVFANLAAWLTATFGPAGIPIALGLSAGVGAVALSQVKHLDVGGYVVSPGLAMLHANETVVPAKVNTPFAGAGAGAGGNSTTHNWNISAWDGRSVQAWLKGGGAQQISRAVDQHQSINPSSGW
jgi:hypothetical protein